MTILLDPNSPSDKMAIDHVELISQEIKSQIITKKLMKNINPANYAAKVVPMLLYTEDDDGVRDPNGLVRMHFMMDVKKSPEGICMVGEYITETEIKDLKLRLDVDVVISHINVTLASTFIKYGKGLNVVPLGLAEGTKNRMKRKPDDVSQEEKDSYRAILAKRAKMDSDDFDQHVDVKPEPQTA